MNIEIKLSTPQCLPVRGTYQAAGYDMRYCGENPKWIFPFTRKAFNTGVTIVLPVGHEAQIRPRSGLSFKKGLFAILGTIDSDFRGEIKILLYNSSFLPIRIKPFERIAQMVIAQHESVSFKVTTHIASDTQRGVNGYGHTGNN